MEVLRVPMKWVEGFAPQRLAMAMECSTSEAVGALVLFLASTRRSGLEEGSYAKVASHVMGTSNVGGMIDGLAKIGILDHGESDRLRIVPNEGLQAQMQMAVERAKRARAMVGKKKATKKKGKLEVAPVAAQGELVVEMNPGTTRVQKVTDHALELRREAWAAYSNAYMQTTRQTPLDNMKQRSLIMHFCKHVGADAPAVLDFYCRHPNRKYITAVYPLTMAVADATGLHTQWRNGSYVTYEGAKSAGFDAEFLHRMGQLDQEYAQLPPEA